MHHTATAPLLVAVGPRLWLHPKARGLLLLPSLPFFSLLFLSLPLSFPQRGLGAGGGPTPRANSRPSARPRWGLSLTTRLSDQPQPKRRRRIFNKTFLRSCVCVFLQFFRTSELSNSGPGALPL